MKRTLLPLLLLLATTTATAQVADQAYIAASLTNGLPVELALQTDSEGICAGYAYYRESQPEPLLVVGFWEEYPGEGDTESYHNIRLSEFQPDGRLCGKYIIHLRQPAGQKALIFCDAERTYAGPDGDAEEIGPLRGNNGAGEPRVESRMPGWFSTVEQPLQPATADDLGEIYEYITGESNGGFFELVINDDGTLYFEVTDMPVGHATASATNDPDRLARLSGNVMEYPRVNDCGDTLRATFFKLFAIVQTLQTPGPDHGCRAIDAAFIKKSYPDHEADIDEDEE
ncbi:MAG: hypothetical protein IJ722_02015 [Alloprevotella sp.]|nr:hypothetical protein [Alloprevotella sp.]